MFYRWLPLGDAVRGECRVGFNSGGRSWSELERALSGEVEAPPGDGGDGPAWSRHRDGYPGPPPDLVDRYGWDDVCAGLPRVPYAELHAHSNFSFLDGASHPEQLVEEAARAGLDAIALTDHDGMYGVVRFADAARELGVRTVYGAELSLGLTAPQNGVADPEGTHLLVLARNVEGYRRLCRVISEAHLRGAEKGKPVYDMDEIVAELRGHGVVLTGCRKGAVRQALVTRGVAAAWAEVRRLVGWFGREHVMVELTDHGYPLDSTHNDLLAADRRGPRRGGGRVEQRALRPARRRPAGRRGRRGPGAAQHRGAGRVAAAGTRGVRADGGGDGPPVPPLSGRGAAGGAAGPGVRVRPEAGRRRSCRRSRCRPGTRRSPGCASWWRGARPAGTGPSGQPEGVRAARPRAGDHREAELPRLLPGGVGHRGVLPPQRHPGPGPRLGGELGGLLRAGDHQRGPGEVGPAVRTLPGAGARRAAGHRRGHRVGPPRGGDPVRLPQARPPARRAGGERDHLPGALGGAGHGQGARLLAGPAGRVVQADRPLGPGREGRRGLRAPDPGGRAGAGRIRSGTRRGTWASTPAAW